MRESKRHSAGSLTWVARDADVSLAVEEFFDAWTGPFGFHGELRALGELDTYFKAEPLKGRARWRHGARRLFLRRPFPRLAEYENLQWLSEHGFEAAEPLAAGVLQAWNGAAWQFLFTLKFENVQPLVGTQSPAPSVWLDELAREVARLHELEFIHRDLHLRNLVCRLDSDGTRILFYDTWRGGARLQSRGVAYDLACLTHGLATELGEEVAQAFLDSYHERRDSASEALGLQRRIRIERRRLARK